MASKVPFSPQGGAGQKIAATQTASSDALSQASGTKQVLVANLAGSDTAFVRFGGSGDTAVKDVDMPILAGESRVVSITSGVTHVSVVCDTGLTATVWVIPGNGS